MAFAIWYTPVYLFLFFFFFSLLVMVSPDLKCSQVLGWRVCLDWIQSDDFNAHVMSVGVYGEGILVLSFLRQNERT
jgi:hypothetical protein